ncbi:trichohyalin-like [Zerene cesonia]|uniref:trichohyalin-like n=1 Tax=Zerene cesonia TaxID=33412 RepID=UPI0018E4F94C|nr:trichohyalin-like [Zerene cesonia]
MMADEEERGERSRAEEAQQARERGERGEADERRRRELRGDEQRELRDGLLLQMEDHRRGRREERQRDQHFCDAANVLMAANDEDVKERTRKKKEVNNQYGEDLREQIEDDAARRQMEREEYRK